MKKLIILITILLLATGCSAIKKIKGNKAKEEYSLVSTTDRLVFKDNNNYEVVYFENDKIVKVERAIKFKDDNEAKEYYLKEKYGNTGNIYLVGDTFVISEPLDYYEDYNNLSKDELINYMENANFIKK